MSFQTLPITPSYGSDFAFKANRLKNQFGDGYSQTAINGINAVTGTLNLEWKVLTWAQKDALVDNFFAVLSGSTAFYYAPYGSDTNLLWKCAQWDVEPLSTEFCRVTATLEQSFDLTS